MINLSREREDLRTKLDAHIIEGVLIINGDQANRQSEMPKPPRPANSMEVRLRITREIKVDYDIYRLDVNPTGAEVGGDKIPTILFTIQILIHIHIHNPNPIHIHNLLQFNSNSIHIHNLLQFHFSFHFSFPLQIKFPLHSKFKFKIPNIIYIISLNKPFKGQNNFN